MISFFQSPTWSFFSDEDRLKKTTAAKCSFGQQVSESIVLFYLSVGQHFQTNNQYPSPSHGSWTSPLLKGKEARHSASSKHKEIKKKRVKEGKYSQCFVIMWFDFSGLFCISQCFFFHLQIRYFPNVCSFLKEMLSSLLCWRSSAPSPFRSPEVSSPNLPHHSLNFSLNPRIWGRLQPVQIKWKLEETDQLNKLCIQ